MLLLLNMLSESRKFVLFRWEHCKLSINRTCVCICVELNNYAAFDEIPWEINSYESKNSVLDTNPYKFHHLSGKYSNIVREMILLLNMLSESCKFVLFGCEHCNLSINRTCVCICVELNNYAVFDKIPWEINGYESTNSVLATNPYKIHHLSWKYWNIVRKMMLLLNMLSESCKFVVFRWEHCNFSINRTCVCICVELNNYAAFDEIPW